MPPHHRGAARSRYDPERTHRLAWSRSAVWKICFGAGALALVGLAIWCAMVVMAADQLRTDFGAYRDALRATEQAQAAVVDSRAPGPPRAAGEQLRRFAEDLEPQRAGD